MADGKAHSRLRFFQANMAVQWQKEIRHILTKVRRVSQKSELKLADKLAS